MGGQYPPAGGGGGGGGQETERYLADLKKEIENLRKEQEKRQLEGLKSKIEELRAEKTEQKIEELRRAIERMHGAPHGGMRLLPHPFPKHLPPLPAPRSSPELPSPRQALIHLKVPAGATLFVNGKQVDPAPAFLTPELEPEKDYDYDFRVKVTDGDKETTRAKRVSVRAGSVVNVAYEDMPARTRRRPSRRKRPPPTSPSAFPRTLSCTSTGSSAL